jgi:hypothetical protein
MFQNLLSRHSRIAGAIIGCLGVVVLSGAPARAATLMATGACDNATLSQPFSSWGDANQYKLIPGGTFQGGAAGWTLSKGATVVAGGAPFGVTAAPGSSSLDLAPGASVTSPFTCVNLSYPTFRFFARNNGLLSNLSVSVVYNQAIGGQLVLPVGTVALNGAWKPSAPMLTQSALGGLLSGGSAQVALRFTSLSGDSQIDGVYVDPRMHD